MIDPPIIILILGFLMVGLGLNLIPLETFVGPGWRHLKLSLGVAFSLLGAALLIFNAETILRPSLSHVLTPTPTPGTPTLSNAQTPTSDLRLIKKNSTSFDCSKVFIQFLDPNPEYNEYSDGRLGEEGQPLLEMKFHMQAINITDKDQLVTICYSFKDRALPAGWAVEEPVISLKAGSAEYPLPSYRMWLPPKASSNSFFPLFSTRRTSGRPTSASPSKLLGPRWMSRSVCARIMVSFAPPPSRSGRWMDFDS